MYSINCLSVSCVGAFVSRISCSVMIYLLSSSLPVPAQRRTWFGSPRRSRGASECAGRLPCLRVQLSHVGPVLGHSPNHPIRRKERFGLILDGVEVLLYGASLGEHGR